MKLNDGQCVFILAEVEQSKNNSLNPCPPERKAHHTQDTGNLSQNPLLGQFRKHAIHLLSDGVVVAETTMLIVAPVNFFVNDERSAYGSFLCVRH